MNGVLWQLLASSRGARNRARIVRALDERPRNPNQLADELDVDYTTVRHHLDVLCDNGVLEPVGEDYGAVYVFTDQLEANRDVLADVLGTVELETDARGDTDDSDGREGNEVGRGDGIGDCTSDGEADGADSASGASAARDDPKGEDQP